MNALDLLLNRQSDPLLTFPAPNSTELQQILSAGMRVPDHAALKPFSFMIVEKEGLQTLSDIFVNTVQLTNTDQAKLDKTAKMPFRAPLIIIVSTQYKTHEKVPKNEQLITAGCSVHAMQMACVALGFGAMWRSGNLSYDPLVKKALNINSKEDIVGFLYIGTKQKVTTNKPQKFYDDRVSYL